jgi:DNA-directed RNA polymerase subunit RPC12/RpoP
MIKILKKGNKIKKVECENCGSLLQYGDKDLRELPTWSSNEEKKYEIKCPYCSYYISVKKGIGL